MNPQSVLLAVAILSIAGCTQPPDVARAHEAPSPSDAPLTAEDGRDLRTELQADDRVEAPRWQIGERFRHHVFFGSEDTEGRHYDTIVVAETPAAWILATDDREVAKVDAIQDYPILGDIQKSDLTMSAFGDSWDLYQFPLHHGAHWESDFPNIAWDAYPDEVVHLTFNASYAPDILTPEGPRPGFEITALGPDGRIVAAYDYVPAIGWFAHLTVYDIDEGQDPIEFHATSMGHDLGWHGTLYLDEARVAIENLGGYGVDPDGGTQPFVIEPSLTATFTVSPDAEYLMGLVAALVVAGIEEIALLSPSREVHHWETAGAPIEEFQTVWETAAETGEWRLVAVGAGVVALSYVELYEIDEVTTIL
jgi:hypothetical protein